MSTQASHFISPLSRRPIRSDRNTYFTTTVVCVCVDQSAPTRTRQNLNRNVGNERVWKTHLGWLGTSKNSRTKSRAMALLKAKTRETRRDGWCNERRTSGVETTRSEDGSWRKYRSTRTVQVPRTWAIHTTLQTCQTTSLGCQPTPSTWKTRNKAQKSQYQKIDLPGHTVVSRPYRSNRDRSDASRMKYTWWRSIREARNASTTIN
jgi:hypothetical protein